MGLAQTAGITDDLAQIAATQSVTMGLAQTAGITDDLAQIETEGYRLA